ncbi:MAG: DUF1571 domain-containing protein [Pirellulaceae bacterium]
MKHVDRRKFLSVSAIIGSSLVAASAVADDPQNGLTTEPVYRTSKNENTRPGPAHPLDPALQIAYACLKNVRENIIDYSAIMIKRERVGGVLGEHEFMGIKVRNRKIDNGQLKTPFSVYMAFLRPATVKGREVIYVENQNDGNIVAHEGGMKGRFLPTVNLPPTGMMAMRGQRYPITDMGIENLVTKLIEKGERDRARDECDVQFSKGAKVGGRSCTMLTVTHPVERPYFDFHVAEIFIDDEMQVPVRYAAYVWPTTLGGEKILLEEYTYQNIKLNVGFADIEFDRRNPKYNF